MHYMRCSTPAGSVQRFQASAPALFAAVGAFSVLQHPFYIVSAGLVGLYAVFMGPVMKLYFQTIKSPLRAVFGAVSSVGGLTVVLWGDLSSWPRSDAGPYTFQRVGCLAAAADRCTKFIDKQNAGVPVWLVRV